MSLIIADKQMAALEAAELLGFHKRMMKHLQECFPQECARTGNPGIDDLIFQGITRAAAYGLRSELDVARYIDVSLVLRHHGDEFGLQEWDAKLLQAKVRPPIRMRMIFDEVIRSWRERGQSPSATTD